MITHSYQGDKCFLFGICRKWETIMRLLDRLIDDDPDARGYSWGLEARAASATSAACYGRGREWTGEDANPRELGIVIERLNEVAAMLMRVAASSGYRSTRQVLCAWHRELLYAIAQIESAPPAYGHHHLRIISENTKTMVTAAQKHGIEHLCHGAGADRLPTRFDENVYIEAHREKAALAAEEKES
jgi:hypothetical protein